MTKHKYHIRYSVEVWDKPAPPADRRVHPAVSISRDDYGYTDEILIVSILRDEETGEIGSIGLFDSESGSGQPSRKMLELIRDHINHCLSQHCSD